MYPYTLLIVLLFTLPYYIFSMCKTLYHITYNPFLLQSQTKGSHQSLLQPSDHSSEVCTILSLTIYAITVIIYLLGKTSIKFIIRLVYFLQENEFGQIDSLLIFLRRPRRPILILINPVLYFLLFGNLDLLIII